MSGHMTFPRVPQTRPAAPYDKRKLSYAGTFTDPWAARVIRAMEWMTGKLALLRRIRRFERRGTPHGQAFWSAALREMGMPFAIATSSTRDQAREKLAAARLTDSFDIVVTRSDVPDPKPAPDVYLLAAKRLGIDPTRCLAFEDSDIGARAARAAGMTVVQVPDMTPLSGDHADLMAEDLIAGARGIGLLAA